jgi:hypothetical protein
MTHPVKSPKKLIEVALPLDAINKASAREGDYAGKKVGQALSLTELACQAQSLT